MTRIENHPVADLFPMMTEDELREMAADIGERGLLHPIVRDGEGRVLDGRNRLAACTIAGVEPVFEEYGGDDAAGYALAVNIKRRHLTKGQQAMIAARALSIDGVKKLSTRQAGEAVGVSHMRVSQARTVLQFAPDLADGVVSGEVALDEAYAKARENKQEADTDEAARLRLPADLAELVSTGHRTLKDAGAEADARAIVAKIDETVRGDGERPYADRVAAGGVTWGEAAQLATTWLRDRAESIGRDRDRIEVTVQGLKAGQGLAVRINREPETFYVRELLGSLPDETVQRYTEIIKIMNEEDDRER
jgi:hypothetical protein